MMHTDSIRAQIQALEDEVRQDPRAAAIQHLKAALSVLEKMNGAVSAQVEQRAVQPLVRAEPPKPQYGSVRKGSKIGRIRDIVGQHIDDNGPTHRSVLVRVLNDAGLNEGVKNPMTAFATSMHTLKDYFISDGQGTFRRRESVPGDVSGGHQRSPKGDTGGVAPPAASNSSSRDMRTAEISAEAGGT